MIKIRVILGIITYIFFVQPSESEVLYRTLNLMAASGQTASTTGSITTFSGHVPQLNGITCRAVADNTAGTIPTLDIVVQTCTDNTANNCDTVCTFTQCTASVDDCWSDGSQTVDIGQDNVYPYFRAITTIGGTDTPTFDVTVEVRY